MGTRSLVGADGERGSWSALVRSGHPELARHLARPYVDFAQRGPGGGSRIAPPTATVTLILNLGEPFGGLPRSFAAGLADSWVSIDEVGDLACLDVKLTPLGAYTLLGMPMNEIAGIAVDLEDVCGAEPMRRLVARLRERPDRRFELLDSFFLARADAGPRPSPAVEWAWRRLNETAGSIPIGALAAEIGWSRRHLIAQFRSQIGLPPKRLARILRFNRALRRLRTTPAARWAEIAFDCGYYDQAHLNRDFRDLAGTTPTALLRQVNSFQDTFERRAYDRPAIDTRPEGVEREHGRDSQNKPRDPDDLLRERGHSRRLAEHDVRLRGTA